MTKKKPDVTRYAAMVALLGGLGGCAESGGGQPQVAGGGDPIEAAIEDLGVPIAGCDGSATPAHGEGFASSTLTFYVDTDPLVLSTKGGVFTANGITCTATMSSVQKPLKTTDVQKIVILGTANDNKVILDFLPGSFGTKILGVGGGITVDYATTPNGSATNNDSLMFRASPLADVYKFGAAPFGSAITDIYVEITGDKIADIDLKPSTVGTFSIATTMGAGNDTVIANPVSTVDMDKFSSTSSLLIGPMPAGYGITAYGGPGDDKFTGGFGDDSFFGGDGNDTFKMNGTSDGADIYSGDVGVDTVDYTGRTNALKVDIGPQFPAIEGSSDLRAWGLYGAGGALDTKSLVVQIDGARVVTTFSAPADPGAVLTAINTAANTALGTTALKYASLNGKNHLLITSLTNTIASSVKVEEDPGIAASAGNAANTLVGLVAAATVTTTSQTGTADMSTSSLYGSSASLGGKRLVLQLNGAYVVVSFASMLADSTAMLAAINTAANTALGTSAVVYAKLDASNHLVLQATTIVVLDGAAVVTPFSSASRALGMMSNIESVVDMTTAGLFGSGGSLNTKVLGVIIDGVRVETTFAAPADASAVVTAINAAANTALGTSGAVYASINAAKHLVISSTKDTANSSWVKVSGDPAIAASAGNAANTLVGLAAAPSTVTMTTQTGTADMSTSSLYGSSATLGGKRLVLALNGTYVVVGPLSATLADSTALLAAINTAANTALGTSAVVYATLDTSNHLVLTATSIVVLDGAAAKSYTSADTVLGLIPASGVVRTVADADDGEALEHDDVRYSTENITGGTGNDTLIGNDQKNVILGMDGNDSISGGGNVACTMTSGDTLTGGAGDDTFLMPVANCKATLSGGDGNNTADFSGRAGALTLKNNGTADDGESGELANIAVDITKMIGGFGADAITGGVGDDTLVGGPGADTLIGGTGNDTADYSASPAAVNIPLCFAMAIGTCTTATDGYGASADVAVYQVEHVIGSAFNDTIDGHTSTTVELTIEGGAGDDVITGGAANDTLWGDAGNDTLYGMAGDDSLSGDAGNDILDGGGGDGDICLGDSSDLVAKVSCEL